MKFGSTLPPKQQDKICPILLLRFDAESGLLGSGWQIENDFQIPGCDLTEFFCVFASTWFAQAQFHDIFEKWFTRMNKKQIRKKKDDIFSDQYKLRRSTFEHSRPKRNATLLRIYIWTAFEGSNYL